MHSYDKKVLTIYLKKVLIACGQSCKIIFTWSLKFTILMIHELYLIKNSILISCLYIVVQ